MNLNIMTFTLIDADNPYTLFSYMSTDIEKVENRLARTRAEWMKRKKCEPSVDLPTRFVAKLHGNKIIMLDIHTTGFHPEVTV